jgi:hypothetical protein
MPVDGYEAAVKHLRRRVRNATREQRDLAAAHGLPISTRTPFLVAGAQLSDQLAEVLGTDPLPATEGRLEYLADLVAEEDIKPPSAASAGVVQAWIDHLLARRTLTGLLEVRPEPGDVVYLRRRGETTPRAEDVDAERVRMVSSVDRDGRVHFRGPGQRAWPDAISLLCRADATGEQADKWRDQALALASVRDRSDSTARSLSSHKWRLLEPWRVRERETLERDVDALRGIIETATDERPIQRHLEQHPWLLASLLGGGQGRWVRPQVSLGREVVADFFIADADSAGVRWRLIELESPRVPQRLQNGDFAKEARHAVHQIEQCDPGWPPTPTRRAARVSVTVCSSSTSRPGRPH